MKSALGTLAIGLGILTVARALNYAGWISDVREASFTSWFTAWVLAMRHPGLLGLQRTSAHG